MTANGQTVGDGGARGIKPGKLVSDHDMNKSTFVEYRKSLLALRHRLKYIRPETHQDRLVHMLN
jgi:hypothetical protein